MLDENLPTYLLKPSHDKPKSNSTFYYSQHGSEYEPSYSLKQPDPDLPASKNRYAAALCDAFNPEVLYAEVLLIPEWTQPTLSAEAIRLNGGVPPPPEPVLPAEFAIQLYNPDQQVVVRQKHGSWGAAPSWEFEIPQQSFRQPSASSLDRTQHDPAASEITPKISFKWRKDSKLSKDLACFLSGKATNPDGSKKKNREPDITIAIFKALKEITMYEPNFQRVEIEDMKGFEVVLLLGAVVIRDVYFGHMKETFNITEVPHRLGGSASPVPPAALTALYSSTPSTASPYSQQLSHTSPKPTATSPPRDPRVPPTDPRSQWEIDAETARLRKQTEAEERERKRKEHAERKQIKKMLEAEEKEQRRKQAEIDKETERLKKVYGQEEHQVLPSLPPRPGVPQQHYSTPQLQSQYERPQTQPQYGYYPNSWGPPVQAPNGPYLGVPGGQPFQTGFPGPPAPNPQRLKEKKSFFGFRRDVDEERLQKKRSAQF